MEILSEEDDSRRRSRTVDRLCRLPVFSHTALKLLTIATDAESAGNDFEAAFRSDPALATDLLILANSAEFGFRTEVLSIRHALSMLGLERARSLACRIAMTFYLRGSANAGVSAAWQHSMASAALAEPLAEMSSLSSPILYTAALLHDIGSLGLQLSWQKEYSSLMELRIAEADKVLAAERVLFGVNHCEAGEALGRTWGFPEALQRHIHNHHGHVPFDQDPVTNLVQTACRMAEVLGYPEAGMAPGASELGWEEAIPARFREHAALKRERLAAIVETHLAATKGL